MAPSVRLLMLPLLLLAIAPESLGGPFSKESDESSKELSDKLEEMKDAGCFPEDITIPEFPTCDGADGGPLEMLRCVANSAGFSDESGYNNETSKAFIDNLSEDTQWRDEAKGKLDVCLSMMMSELPANRQGVFMFSCWMMLLKFQCNAKRVGDAMEQVVGSEGQSIGQALVYLAEGHCITEGLKHPESADDWNTCSEANDLDMEVLADAGEAYMMFAYGSDETDEPSEEDISELGEQLDNFNATVHCTMLAIGEISPDGQLDFDVMRDNLNISQGKDYIKNTAAAVLDFCQGESPNTPNEFVTCWFGTLPNVCTSIKAHGLALSAEAKQGCGAGGRRPGGRRQRGRNGRRRQNGRRRRNRRRRPQQQPAEEV